MSEQKKLPKTYVKLPEFDHTFIFCNMFSSNPIMSTQAWIDYQQYKEVVAYREEQELQNVLQKKGRSETE